MTALLACFLVALLAGAPATDTQTGPLNNDDIVALVKSGFSDSVVIAKIHQTSAVDFALDTDGMVRLKKSGVSDKVIEAMLQRGGGLASVAEGTRAAGDVSVWLVSDGDRVELAPVTGTTSTVWAYVKMMMYSNYLDLRARVRIKNTRPEFVLRAPDVANRYFVVRLDPDQDDGVRSVKIKTGVFGGAPSYQPDSDWQFPFDAVKDGLNWRVTLKSALRPGEYGVLDRTGRLWDFAIDK